MNPGLCIGASASVPAAPAAVIIKITGLGQEAVNVARRLGATLVSAETPERREALNAERAREAEVRGVPQDRSTPDTGVRVFQQGAFKKYGLPELSLVGVFDALQAAGFTVADLQVRDNGSLWIVMKEAGGSDPGLSKSVREFLRTKVCTNVHVFDNRANFEEGKRTLTINGKLGHGSPACSLKIEPEKGWAFSASVFSANPKPQRAAAPTGSSPYGRDPRAGS